jgi:hypothetical protein
MIIGLSSLFFVSNEGISTYDKYNDKVSYLENSRYDFKIFSPTLSQVQEFENSFGINNILPFYKSNAQIRLEGQNTSEVVLSVFSEESYDINLTEFNDHRLLMSAVSATEAEEIYIDQKTATLLNASPGDMVLLTVSGGSEAHFELTRIYENFNFYDQGTVFFYYTETIKETVNSNLINERKIEGIYLSTDDVVATKQYLEDNYIPFGNLLPYPSIYFSSQLEYDQYVQDFIEDYKGSQIFYKSEVLEQVKINNEHLLESTITIKYTSSFILFVGTLFVSIKVMYGHKKAKDLERKTNSNIKKTDFLFMFLQTDMIVAMVLIELILLFKLANLNYVYQTAYINELVIYNIVGVALATTINLVISFIATYKMNQKSMMLKRRIN